MNDNHENKDLFEDESKREPFAKKVARFWSIPMGKVFEQYNALLKVMVEREKEIDGK